MHRHNKNTLETIEELKGVVKDLADIIYKLSLDIEMNRQTGGDIPGGIEKEIIESADHLKNIADSL